MDRRARVRRRRAVAPFGARFRALRRSVIVLLALPWLMAATFVHPDNRPLAVAGATNGDLAGSVLEWISPVCSVHVSVAPELRAMLAAAAADGVRLVPRDCYRTLALQEYWRGYWCGQGACQMAAVPGTSIHGWGKAIDFGDSDDQGLAFGSPGYIWMKANAARFNFNHPGWAEPGTGSSEPWHWEWVGDGGTMFGPLDGAAASPGGVSRNADGRLEVFGVAADGALAHTWQQPGIGWSPVARFGGSFEPGSVQVIDNDDGRLEVFALGTDHVAYHAFQVVPNGGWSPFYALGPVDAAPSVGRYADGRLTMLVVDATGALRHSAQVAPNSGWTAPVTLGTGFAGSAGMGATPDDRLLAFAVGTDGSLRQTAQAAPNGAFGAPVRIGPGVEGRPAVGFNADGRAEVFVRGTDGRLWHSWQVGWTMSGLAPLSDAPIAGDPIVNRSPNGRLEVFAVEPSGALGHQWQVVANGGWSSWYAMPGPRFSGAPAIATNDDGRFEIFATVTGDTVAGTSEPDGPPSAWHAWQLAPNTGWSGFVSLTPALSL